MKKSWPKLLFLLVVSIAVIVSLDNVKTVKSLAQSSVVQLDTIPKTVEPCLNQEATNKLLEAGVTYDGNEYYLISYDAINPITDGVLPWLTAIKYNDLGCLVVIPESVSYSMSPETLPSHKSLSESLTLYLPEAVAKEMALQRFKKESQQPEGKQKLEEFVSRDDSDALEDYGNDTFYVFPEDLWALQQLDIQLPQNIQVVETWEQIHVQ